MLVSFIKRMESLAQRLPPNDSIKICLASRPWPIFQKELGNNARIPSCAIHDFTAGDIESYTSRHLLQALPAGAVDSLSHEQWSMARLAEKVSRKAQGVFVWVRLVVEELCRNIQDGSTTATLEDILSTLPDELEELYEYTMKRIPANYALETLVACRILLASLSPLTLEALHCATRVAISGTYEITQPATRAAWLKSRTGGLIEEVGTSDDTTRDPADNGRSVQLIHQTAAEFVRKGIPGLSSADNQVWVEEEGSVFIFRAIATQHPPFSPLKDLALQLFHHLRTVDLILDREEAYQSERLLPFVPLSGKHPHHPHLSGSNPLSELYTSGRLPYDCPLNMMQSDELVRHYMTSMDAKTLQSLDKHKYPRGFWWALVLLGVRNINWYRVVDSLDCWSLLGLVALGPRVPSFPNPLRLRMVERMLRETVLREATLSDSRETAILFPCLLWVSHPTVDDDTRLGIMKVVLSALRVEPGTLMHGLGVVMVRGTDGKWVPGGGDDEVLVACGFEPLGYDQPASKNEGDLRLGMSLLDFCARFKDTRWLDILVQYDPSSRHRASTKDPWWIDLPVAIATSNPRGVSKLKPRVYAGLSGDGDESMARVPAGSAAMAGMALAGLILGSLGFPQLWRATYIDDNAH